MKAPRSFLPSFLIATSLAGGAAMADTPAKVTYNDHILPIFRNACLNCHNPDKKKAGLDLSTYQAALAGSDNGKVVESGNPNASLLIKCTKQIEDPKMPPKGDKLTDAEIAMLEKWVSGQLLESATGKAVAASNNVQVAVVSLERPAGPPPMPTTDLPLEPLVHTKTTNALVALAASPWAPLVAVGGQKQIILYNTETLQSLGILSFPEGFPAIIRFSKNGKLLLTGGGLGGKFGKVVLWDVQTGERAGEVGNEFDQVLGADLSPDQAHVALGGPNKVLKIYATKDGALEHSIKKHTDWITAVAFSPDGKYLASADRNGGIAIWEGATGREYNSLPGHKAAVTALAFMPGVLASAGEDGKIMLWDVKEGKEIRSWAAHNGGVSSVDFTTDGRLVSAGRDKLAKAWDQTGKLLLTTEPFDDIALRAVMADERIVAGDWTGKIRVFSLKEGGKRAGELTANPPTISDSLTAVQKQLADAKATLASTQQALAAAENNVKAALEAAKQKHQQELAAAEAASKQAQAELETLKTAPSQVEAELKAAQAKLEEATKTLAATAEAEHAPAQQAVETQKQQVAAVEKRLASVQAETKAKRPATEKKVQDTGTALAAAQKAEIKLVPAPESIAKVAEINKRLETLRAEANKLSEARGKLKAGSPEYAKADGLVQAKNNEVNQAQANLQAAQQAASASPQELEVARLKAALEESTKQVASATTESQRWQRAQAFMTVHKAKQNLSDLQAKYEDLVATAKDALSPIAKAASDLATAQKTVEETPALLKAKEAGLATAKTAAQGAIKAAADAEAALADAEARHKTALAAQDKATSDLPQLTKKSATDTAEVTRLEKVLATATPEGKPKPADVETKLAAAKAVAAETQKALELAKKTVDDSKPQIEKLDAEIAKAKELVTNTRLEAKSTGEKAVKADAALTATRKDGEAAEKTVAELKQKSGEIADAARVAKAKAEQEAATVAKQLETAKAAAERAHAEFETRYRSAQTTAKPGGAGAVAAF